MTSSDNTHRIMLYGAVALIVICGIWYVKSQGIDDPAPKAAAQTEVPAPANVSYDEGRKCPTLDLEPGKKFVDLIANSHYFHIVTRNMRAKELAEPELEIISLTGKPVCAYIIREHALPAPAASK